MKNTSLKSNVTKLSSRYTVFVATFVFVVSSIVSVLSSAVEADQMTCVRLTGTKLPEFKEKLVESCDLNKPFSTSLSRLLNEETYLFCCHKRTK